MPYLAQNIRIRFLSTLSLRRATSGQAAISSSVFYFYPRSPCGERHPLTSFLYFSYDFYPRSPCGERRKLQYVVCGFHVISIHALLAESDNIFRNLFNRRLDFYPRSPCGERPPFVTLSNGREYFYPRSPCGERPCAWSASKLGGMSISIHALLAESDGILLTLIIGFSEFLSTLSLRRATSCMILTPRFCAYFYPRSPCGERQLNNQAAGRVVHISIHALLAESDASLRVIFSSAPVFLSTLSLRRATASVPFSFVYLENFYPRSPCGERLIQAMPHLTARLFLSTLSLRRATLWAWTGGLNFDISIHALLAESDGY